MSDLTPVLPVAVDDETNRWARAGDERPVAVDLRRSRFGAITASGGMGIVHRVRDLQLGRDLAVKTIRERLGRCSPTVRCSTQGSLARTSWAGSPMGGPSSP